MLFGRRTWSSEQLKVVAGRVGLPLQSCIRLLPDDLLGIKRATEKFS